MIEPRITINGTVLSEAEAITVRVALNSFAIELTEGLGDDEVGSAICNGYKRCLKNIFQLI